MSGRLQHMPGDFIGPGQQQYKVLERLGSGGMGTVYKVENVLTGNVYAVKECDLLDDPNGRELSRQAALQVFLAEGREVERLQHPGIPRGFLLADEDVHMQVCLSCGASVLEGGECPNAFLGGDTHHEFQQIDRRLYLFMAYIDGIDAAEAAAKMAKPLSRENLRSVLDGLVQIADTLDFLHQRNLIHRDVKPENLRITAQQTFLLDFGLVAEEPPSMKTRRLDMPTAFHGTEGFAAPEQVLGRPRCASDSFSLAMTLLSLATGEDPGKPEVAERFRTEDPKELVPSLSQGLAQCVERARAEKPDLRPTMADWVTALSPIEPNQISIPQQAQTRQLRVKPHSYRQAPSPTPLRPGGRKPKTTPAARHWQLPSIGFKVWGKYLLIVPFLIILIVGLLPRNQVTSFDVEALPGATIYLRMDDLREGRVLSGGEKLKVRYDESGLEGNWLRVLKVNGKRSKGYLLRSKVFRSRS